MIECGCIVNAQGYEDAVHYLISDRGYTPMRATTTVDEYVKRKSSETGGYVSYLEFYNLY